MNVSAHSGSDYCIAGKSLNSFISYVFLHAARNIYEMLISDQFHCIYEIMTLSGVALRIDYWQFRHFTLSMYKGFKQTKSTYKSVH